jgi:peptidoglycan/xylan/chitin deacetylase (PgdA/CDA1 family)
MKLLSEEGKQIEVILSFDDGKKQDIRLADLLMKYNLSAIFYIPSRVRELSDKEVRELSEYFAIGGHTENHRYLSQIPLPEAECEVVEGKQALEALIGAKVTSFCYPRGRYTKSVKDIVRDAGFLEARTTKVGATRRSEDPYELNTTVHVYNRKEYEGRYWLAVALDYFDKVVDTRTSDNYFHLWGHSWEIDKYNYWKDLEFILSYISKKIVSDYENL